MVKPPYLVLNPKFISCIPCLQQVTGKLTSCPGRHVSHIPGSGCGVEWPDVSRRNSVLDQSGCGPGRGVLQSKALAEGAVGQILPLKSKRRSLSAGNCTAFILSRLHEIINLTFKLPRAMISAGESQNLQLSGEVHTLCDLRLSWAA